ncbi:MAG: ShlB/FhaC/HecB family hemolysin secretion/activation protein [Anaerolineae bacterium]|nr:ShlB/FhaC/HecB family hemolysin secretion/activation protein [Gloeobacterales cyanobacterium ES-bin-313]
MAKRTFLILGWMLATGLASSAAMAQTVLPGSPQQPDPNRDRFPQQVPLPQPLPKTDKPVLPDQAPPSTTSPTQSITIRSISVTGNTLFSKDQINKITQPLIGQSLNRDEILSKIVAPITKLYLEQGYLTSRAELVSSENGDLRIVILEGSLSRIDVEGADRLNPDYIRDRIKLGVTTPLNAAKLEEQLRLLRADPLLDNIEASLRRGTEAAQSILIVRIQEAKNLQVGLSFDNYSPPSVGSERGSAFVRYRNLTGIGDEITAAYSVSTGASNVYDLIYRAPLNPMNGTFQLRILPNTFKVTDSNFSAFGIRGNSELYEVSLRQPLLRTLTEEFALSIAFAIQNGQTFLFNNIPTAFGIGPSADGLTRTNIFKFGQDYLSRDEGGAWSLRSQFALGVGTLNSTLNQDPVPDGRFFSWLGQIQRLQLLSNGALLLFQADAQFSFDPLLASQQFVIGGGQSIRGFRQNARQGDNGFRATLEARFPLARNESGVPILQIAPFVEGGGIWNVNGNPNILPDQRYLVGAGLGLLWEPIKRFNIRLDYGVPLINLADRGSNLQDNGFYFSLNYQP